jgi:hypothetical protein
MAARQPDDVDLPGVPEPMAELPAQPEADEDPDDEITSASPPRRDGGDEAPFTKTYVAIDGVAPEELTESQKDVIQRELADLCITRFGLPITGVRIANEGNRGLIELNVD